MKIPSVPMTPANEFHKSLLQASNKAEVINILLKRASQHGWLSDMPDGLWDKLQSVRHPRKPLA
jgi:hypothetical protein